MCRFDGHPGASLPALGGILERPDHLTEGIDVDRFLEIVGKLVARTRALRLRLPHRIEHCAQVRAVAAVAVLQGWVKPARPRNSHVAGTGRALTVPPIVISKLVVWHAQHKLGVNSGQLPAKPASFCVHRRNPKTTINFNKVTM